MEILSRAARCGVVLASDGYWVLEPFKIWPCGNTMDENEAILRGDMTLLTIEQLI